MLRVVAVLFGAALMYLYGVTLKRAGHVVDSIDEAGAESEDTPTRQPSASRPSRGCAHVVARYCREVATGWQQQLTHTGLTCEELHIRMDGVWSGMAFISALLATITFITFQKVS